MKRLLALFLVIALTAGADARLQVNQLVGFGSGGGGGDCTGTSTVIAGATGTAIGDLVNGGGLAAAFDGDTTQSQAASANKTTSTSGFANSVGKDWGSGVTKCISRFTLYGPDDTSILGAAGGTNCKLQGSTDNFSSSTVDLTASTAFASGSGQSIDISGASITQTTNYQYHRVICNGNGVNTIAYAEVVFYELI